ncbi:hypothetical protein N0V85_005243 [Neurospora sp. IMI 360204]|nr:hypothetical protein N0V85_005243 [Neurospora sp. IMI 360204]
MAPYQSTLRGAGAGGEGVNNRGQMDPSNYHDAIQKTIVRIMEDVQVARNSEVTQSASTGPGTVGDADMATPLGDNHFNMNSFNSYHANLEPGNNSITDFDADLLPGSNPNNGFHADLEPGSNFHFAGPLLAPTIQPLATPSIHSPGPAIDTIVAPVVNAPFNTISTCAKVLRNGIICGQPA